MYDYNKTFPCNIICLYFLRFPISYRLVTMLSRNPGLASNVILNRQIVFFEITAMKPFVLNYCGYFVIPFYIIMFLEFKGEYCSIYVTAFTKWKGGGGIQSAYILEQKYLFGWSAKFSQSLSISTWRKFTTQRKVLKKIVNVCILTYWLRICISFTRPTNNILSCYHLQSWKHFGHHILVWVSVTGMAHPDWCFYSLCSIIGIWKIDNWFT